MALKADFLTSFYQGRKITRRACDCTDQPPRLSSDVFKMTRNFFEGQVLIKRAIEKINYKYYMKKNKWIKFQMAPLWQSYDKNVKKKICRLHAK